MRWFNLLLAGFLLLGILSTGAYAVKHDHNHYANLPLDSPHIQLFLRISDYRVEHGKHFLHNNSRLMKVAQDHAEDLTSRQYLSPKTKEGDDIDELLQRAGYEPTTWTISVIQGVLKVDQAFEVLKSDDKARGNLLDNDVLEAGVGFLLKQGKWVVVLARRTAECGNGIHDVEDNEECDDGNTRSGDCCSAECQLEKDCTCKVTEELKAESECHRVVSQDGSVDRH